MLGDLGRITFTYDPATGSKTVTGMESTYPGLGGNDRIALSGSSHWVIAGPGSDEVIAQGASWISTGIGRLDLTASGILIYHDWQILTSPEDSQGGALITVSGYLVEENLQPLPTRSGNISEL